MERLQAALDKARKKRQAGAGPHGAPHGAPHGGPQDGPNRDVAMSAAQEAEPYHPLEQSWAKLTPFDVPEHVLQRFRVVTRSAGPAAAPFDILRTKMLVQMRQNGWKRLAITSPMPDSGKTTMACNIALGLGRQLEMRSILFDLDLREPSVNTYFDAMPEYGIGELLSGDRNFSEQAVRIGSNVAVSMARRAEKDPSRLLLAEDTAQVLDEIELTYQPDIMIFDLPSVLVNDDTRAFLKNVDCALLVIRANTTRYSHFDASERELADQTNVLGVVLNAYSNYNVATPE